MKKEIMHDRSYVAPECDVIDIVNEGVFCSSGDPNSIDDYEEQLYGW